MAADVRDPSAAVADDLEAGKFIRDSENVISAAEESGKLQKRTTELVDQTSRYPLRQLLAIFGCLQALLFTSFLDQASVAAILPVIAADLGAADTINWVGTSWLIATASTQMICARLSDIFGRKALLVSMVCTFMIANIACGFARSAVMLFVFRGFSGIGAGGINGLTMVIVSDIVSMRDRGKYQGMTGGAIALGGGVGPLVGAALAGVSWKWAFWLPSIACAVALGPLLYFLRLPVVRGNTRKKLGQIDWYGSVLSLAGSIFVLIPVTAGGVVYRWDSAVVITLFVVGGLALVAFVYVEKHNARYPIMPLRLLTNRSVVLVCICTMAFGWVYIAQLYFYPQYFQLVLGYSTIKSAVFLLPLVLLQPAFSVSCGQITTRTGWYVPQIWFGFCVFSIGLGLTTRFDVVTTPAYIVPILCINAVGIGCTIQTTLVAAQAAVASRDRAVVTGLRNYARFIAGGIGLAVCGTIRNLVLRDHLSHLSLSIAQIDSLVSSGRLDGLGDTLREEIAEAQMAALHAVFWTFPPLAIVSALLSFFIPNEKLQREGKPASELKPASEAKDVPG